MPLLIGAEQTKHLEQPENLEAQKGASENTPLLNEYSRSYTSGPISAPAHALLGSDENQDNKHWEIQPNASAIIYLLLTGTFCHLSICKPEVLKFTITQAFLLPMPTNL